MKKILLSTMVLFSFLLCANAQGSSTVSSEGQDSNSKSSSKQLPQAIQNLMDDMVYVKGGTFTMGDNSEHHVNHIYREQPEHQVTVSSFFICRYEVTQEVWDAVMGINFSRVKGAKLPVSNVCWDDCQEFVFKLVLMTGINFRLPTEAEWEFAARGGNKSRHTKYSGSNSIDSVAWYAYNSQQLIHPVGQKMPNELGLYDMNGNVSEWCYDYFGRYDSSPQTNPRGVSNSSENVVRGGNYYQFPEICHVTTRSSEIPAYKAPFIGLRLAATP